MKSSLKCILLVACVILSACSNDKKDRAGIDPLAQNKAPSAIEQSFTAKKIETSDTNSQGLSVDKSHVVIQKAALKKEFLLSVNILSQTPTPSFSSLQSRIVSFVMRDQKVYMLDVTKNNIVGEKTNIPQTLLIAEFPILSENKESLELDFNAGMKQIFLEDEWVGSNGKQEAKYDLSSAKVGISYLDEVKIQNTNALYIRQIAQIEGSGKAIPVEVRYQIKPYRPDPSFVPVVSPGLTKVGYFHASPLLLADGSSRTYVVKWNEKKTIKFSISANTPQRFRDTIKQALLYWNKILGENKIEVTQLEDKSITAPNFDLNIVQWIDNDKEGLAVADAQIDPRSGEVMSAQIFIKSGYAKQNKPAELRLIKNTPNKISLKGFESANLCNKESQIAVADQNQRSTNGASEESIEKAIQGLIYETIAHEMGHVLGLRHNFAGSLAANYDFSGRDELIKSYYKNQKAPEGIIPSSSVMDYELNDEAAWVADQMLSGGKALAYDDMAIKHLYFKTELPETNRPAFCTDSDIENYVDCKQFDSGWSSISASYGAYKSKAESLARNLLNIYISASKESRNLSSKLVDVSEVSLYPEAEAEEIMADQDALIKHLKQNVKFVKIRSQKTPVLRQNVAEVEKLEKEYLQSEINRLGGLEKLTQEISENFDKELVSEFAQLLDDPKYNSGELKDGSRYAFTDAEKKIMIENVMLFAPEVKEQLILNYFKILSDRDDESKWADSDLVSELSKITLQKFTKYALTKTDEKFKFEARLVDGTKKQIELPKYKYSLKIRELSTELFANSHSAPELGFLEKKSAALSMQKELSQIGEIEKMDPTSFDRDALQWVLGNQKITKRLEELIHK